MVKNESHRLDATFAALADPTRRGVLLALQAGSRPVSQLAAHADMSLPGFMKHLRALEGAGLLQREKSGRVVTCTLTAEPMKDAAEWLAQYAAFWSMRLDALERYLERPQEKPSWPKSSNDPKSSNAPRSASSATSAPPRTKSGAPGRTRKR